jgi:hypothetical protein
MWGKVEIQVMFSCHAITKPRPTPSLTLTSYEIHEIQNGVSVYLSIIDLERGGFGEILPSVMIFPEGAARGKYHH